MAPTVMNSVTSTAEFHTDVTGLQDGVREVAKWDGMASNAIYVWNSFTIDISINQYISVLR